MLTQGVLTEEFENKVSQYLGAHGGVATSSGTAALVLALQVLGLGPDDEVILPTYVCRSVLEAVITVGAKPVLCDVGQEWVMTPESVEPHLSQRTTAIIAVHTYGLAADINSLSSFGPPIIEDACQSFGLIIDEKSAGSMGSIGVLSFHATKCLTTGEGGMLVTKNPEMIEKARAIRDGSQNLLRRVPAPLSDLQAALGISQLDRYGVFLNKRKQIQKEYYKVISDKLGWVSGIFDRDFLYRFVMKNNGGFGLISKQFGVSNVCVRRGVDSLLHREMSLPDEQFKNAVSLYNRTVSVPFYPALTESEIGRVCDALSSISRD